MGRKKIFKEATIKKGTLKKGTLKKGTLKKGTLKKGILKKGSFEEEIKKKIIDPKRLEEKLNILRKEKKKIVTLNGSFDLLHAGHLHIIYKAKSLADILIIMLNSDSSIKSYKSKKRPIVELKYRLQMMAAIQFVDYVTWFDEINPLKILKIIKPNIHVNGKEYGENCIEKELVESFNGKIYLVDNFSSLSSSKIIEKIKCDL